MAFWATVPWKEEKERVSGEQGQALGCRAAELGLGPMGDGEQTGGEHLGVTKISLGPLWGGD